MSDKVFNIVLKCGCMIAEDTGTPEEPEGNSGLMPCYAEYGDMNKKEDRLALELHTKCWEEYYQEEKDKMEGKRYLTDEELNEIMKVKRKWH
jgi:hypothetical protein